MNAVNLKNAALNGVAWSLIDKIVNQAGNFLLLVYLSRVLSPSDFGLIAMLTIFLEISRSLIDSGFSQALVQRSDEVTENDLSTVFYVNLSLSIFLYITLYFIAPVISEFYKQPELTNLARMLFLVVIINSFGIVPRAILTIAVDFKNQSIANTVATIASAFVAIYMVISDFGYWSLVGMNISRAIFGVVAICLFSKWMPRLVFSSESLRSLFSFGSYLLVAGLVATTVQNLYTVLIGRYFPSEKVGYYQQGYTYTNLLSGTISSVVQGVTYPIMTSIKSNEHRLISIYTRTMGIVVLITFPVFLGFMSIAEEFVLLFIGEKWLPIVPILTILSLARMLTPISSLNLNILNAKGRSDLFLKTDLAKLPMTILALFLAIPYGITGVAIAQAGTVFVSFFINAYYPGKLFGFGWLQQIKLILSTFLASLIMFFAVSLISMEQLLIQFVAKVFFGVFIYIICCYLFKIPSFLYVVSLLRSRLISK